MSDHPNLDLGRIRLLRDAVLDLSIVIDDIDHELAPQLAQRAELVRLLDDARAELEQLLQQRAA